MREFTFSSTYANGGTEALTIVAHDEQEARQKIEKAYPGAKLNWIL